MTKMAARQPLFQLICARGNKHLQNNTNRTFLAKSHVQITRDFAKNVLLF